MPSIDTKVRLMPVLIATALLVPVAAALAYFKWKLTPPGDVVGSYLEDTPDRAKQLERLSQDQTYRESTYLPHEWSWGDKLE